MILIALPVSLLGILILVGAGHFFIRKSLEPLQKIVSTGDSLAKGNFPEEIHYDYQDEIGSIFRSMGQVVTRIRSIINDLSEKLYAIAGGELRIDFENQELYTGEYAPLLSNLKEILKDLNETMGEIKSSALSVNTSAGKVNASAESLSKGASDQASSIEEFSVTMDAISANIKETAEMSADALTISEDAEKAVTKSNRKMEEMTAAMQDITEKSNEISKIIKTIDDIAFQTNILSLNAAIEAARAGIAGKGRSR